MAPVPDYSCLLSTITAEQWKRIGIHRRAGVVVPLFSVFSSESTGIGELPDIRLLVDWCKACGMSIIQLLPMNDTGFGFRPYDAQSMFALDPMYLRLEKLKGIDIQPFLLDLLKIKNEFPAGRSRVDYRIKKAKLDLLWKIFASSSCERADAFDSFVQENAFWIGDYALFKVIKEKNADAGWEEWPDDLKNRRQTALRIFQDTHKQSILFHQWLQWQLFEQFKDVRNYARLNNVLLMGDIPFLASRDSADVWSHQDCFKLDFSSGAPPDLLYSTGQRWGMPPFNWDCIARQDYAYVIEKLKYAQNFYDLYRIDHVVGIFRVWSIPLSEPAQNGGLNGVFDPADENAWEQHGKDLLTLMVKNSNMLACAEDLGTVPNCCFKVLNEMGIPGIDVQRWMRDWDRSYAFKPPETYRKCALATMATHDMSNLCAWWDFECGTVDETLFRRNCEKKNIAFDGIKEKLFDVQASRHGRLRWRPEIDTEEKFLGTLGTTASEVWPLLDMYRGSFKEKQQFLRFLGLENETQEACSTTFIKNALTKIQESACIFSIQLIQDYLDLDQLYEVDPWENRINFPGTLSEKNWTLVLQLSLDDILVLPINSVLKSINETCGRK